MSRRRFSQAGAIDRELQDALIESRQRYKDLVEISSDFAWETDPGGRFTFVSPRGALGWRADELLARDPAEFLVDPECATVFRTASASVKEDVWFRRADGTAACLSIAATPVAGPDGEWRGARGLCRDVTESRRRERDLAIVRLRSRLLTHIVRVMRDELDAEAALTAALTATGLALGAAGGIVLRGAELGAMKPAARWGEPASRAAIEAIVARLDPAAPASCVVEGVHLVGHAARCQQSLHGAILLWQSAELGCFAATDRALLADIADYLGVAIAQIASVEHILALSRTDPLTMLANRRSFCADLARLLARAAHDGRAPGALLYVDVDNFKLVNDRRGHAAGDDALRRIADILRAHGRADDLIARLGGDEFAMWIGGIGSAAAARRGRAIAAACRALGELTGDRERPLGVSVGVAAADPAHQETPDQILARADAAMYDAKRNGKGRPVLAPAARPLEPATVPA